MTFVEAAIEVLRREGKPLTSKRLAELAIKHNLLSVVGRDPEATMELRLSELLKGAARPGDLLEVRPGVYGLRVYPPPTEIEPAAAPAEEGPPTEGRGRSRRGRSRRPATPAVEAGSATSDGEPVAAETAAADEAEPAAGEPGEGAAAAGEGDAQNGAAAPGGARRRRRRRGGRGRRREGAPAGGAEAATDEDDVAAGGEDDEAPALAAAPAAARAPADVAAVADADAAEVADAEEEGGHEEFDAPGGPVIAPTYGEEEMVRSEDDRQMRDAIPGGERRGQRERERGRRRGRGQGREQAREPAREAGRERDRGRDQAAHGQGGRPQPAPTGSRQGPPPQSFNHTSRPMPVAALPAVRRERDLVDGVVDVLRGSGGQMHVRQLVEMGLKRGTLRGEPQDLARQVRVAALLEQRTSDVEGRRPRVRFVGGGQLALERRPEGDLLGLEEQAVQLAARLQSAAIGALERRLPRLPPPGFEALSRALLERLGLAGIEPVRRGEGVVYWGGTRATGAGSERVLVAVRPGEAEVSRRAVGELRAGLQARGFDQGILVAAGRMGTEGATELAAGANVAAHDGPHLARLLVSHGLGVRRVRLAVDLLDTELLAELSD